MQRRWIAGLAAVTAAFVWMGAGAAPPAATGPVVTSAPAPRAASVYVDGAYGYKMQAPNLSPGPSAPGVVIFRGPVINGFASNVNIQIQPQASRADFDKESDEQLKAHDAKINSQKSNKVSGKDAEMVDYELVNGGMVLRYLKLVVFDSDHVVVVTCTSTKDDFARNEAEFRKCLESFELAAMPAK